MAPNVRPLPVELIEKAKVEIFEDPKKLEDSIQYLKEWISKQPHLKARTDDQWLAAFLRGCKFSLEKTKEKLDLHYTLKTHLNDLYPIHPKDPKFKEILKLGATLILPKTVKPDDPRVIILRSGLYDPRKYSAVEIMSIPHYIQQILYLEDDQYIVAGLTTIVDFEGSTMAHMASMTPTQIKKMIVAGQDASPIRHKGSHYLNMHPSFETVFTIVKKFLNEKNRKRICIHSNTEKLYDYVSKDVLPAEYGGNGGTVAEITDYWAKKIDEYQSWFEEDEKYGTDESKRPGKPKTAEDMFGHEGSFRQLQVD